VAEVIIQESESLENALRRFKRKVQQEDIIKEIKKHRICCTELAAPSLRLPSYTLEKACPEPFRFLQFLSALRSPVCAFPPLRVQGERFHGIPR
jgi:hypothetical protein